MDSPNEEGNLRNEPPPLELYDPDMVELPPMSEVRPGYYAMLISGNTESFVPGLYKGEATLTNTNTPIINGRGIRGSIQKELDFLYTQGVIRKLSVFFKSSEPKVNNYPLLTYSDFRERLPEDSVSATYTISSNYRFESQEGRLEIHSLNDTLVEGVLSGTFVSERQDTVDITVHFKAVIE